MSGQQSENTTVTAIVRSTRPVTLVTDVEAREDYISLFVEWLAQPEPERDPKTQKAFGKRYGIHEKTLSRWKRDKSIQERVVAAAKGFVSLKAPKYIQHLERLAEGNDAIALNALKLLVLYGTGWSDKFSGSEREDNFAPRDIVVLVGGKPARDLPVGLIKRPELSPAAA